LPKTVFTGAHQHLVEVLVKARKAAKLNQTEVAERVGKDQTFISLIERSQPVELFEKVVARLPKRFDI
jgi:transcriptional regulator with XRE-family HTH domain